MGQGSETLSGMAEMAEDRCFLIDQMIQDYQDAKKLTGSIVCPVCGRKFRKKTKGHVFCSNKGPANCKDTFWNLTDETRRKRAKEWT